MADWRTGWKDLIRWLWPDDDGDERLTPDTAVSVPAVRNALGKITCHVGQLPVHVLRKRPNGGTEKLTTHQAYEPIKTRPNPQLGAFDFRELLIAHSIMWGDGKAYIDYSSGRLQLWPIMPWCSATIYADGEKFHAIKIKDDDQDPIWRLLDDEKDEANIVMLPDSEVIHIRDFSFNPLGGRGLLKDGRVTFKMALNADKTLNSRMQKGFNGRLLLEAPPTAFRKEEDAKEFIDQFNEYHSGTENAGKAGLLRNGIKAQVVSSSNTEEQMIEMRQFNRQEISLLFGLTSTMGDTSGDGYNSREQKNLQYLLDTLMRWIKKCEEEFDYKLLTPAERRSGVFFKFNTAALLRPDYAAQVDSIVKLRNAKIITANMGLELLDMNPIEGPDGDKLENPNTSSPPTEQRQQRQGEQVPQNMNEIETAVEHWIEVECKTVLDAAAKQKNFVNWMNKHYAWWQSRLESCIERLDGDPQLASEHCARSKDELLQICDIAKQDELVSMVSELVSTWPQRAKSLSERIGVLC